MSLEALAPPLFNNQRESIAFAEDHPRVCDFSDPGTGKTRVWLEVFARRRPRGCKPLLVVAPKTLIYSAWGADCHAYTPWLTYSCAYADNRQKAFDRKADVYITNHDAANWLAKQPDSFLERFGMLVVDESGAFKHHTSKRSKSIAKIKRFFPLRTIMNGSPNTNTVCDVWHQVNIVDDGQRLGKSFYHFRATMCTPEQVGPQANMVKWHDREASEVAVSAAIADITIRHRLKDCQDIPENRKFTVPFQMSGRHESKYREMEDTATLAVKGGTISAINAAALVTKLLQIASGAVYDGEGNYHLLENSRYELVADLAEARPQVVVFFNWTHQRDLLIEEFKRRGLTHVVIDGSVSRTARKEAVERYQAGLYRVMLAHPQSAAHGLTLTKGTRTIWASPTYNLEHWIQGNHRIDRIGQTEKTETVNVLAENTIEGHVYGRLMEKRIKLTSMLEYLAKK